MLYADMQVDSSATGWRRMFGGPRRLALLAAIAGGFVGDGAWAHPYIQRWEFEAAVFFMADEFGTFSEVRLGDRVLGTISFDRTAVRDDYTRASHPEELQTFYDHASQFHVVTLAIDNPRVGEVTHYGNDEGWGVNVYDDVSGLSAPNVESDGMIFEEDLLHPLETEWGGLRVEVWFEAEETIADTPLPDVINLDDWQAFVYFYNSFSGAIINAEIYELTPVEVPFLAGDFNGDGAVDGRDLSVWRWASGSINANLAADANGDSAVDGGDFLTWQRQRGASFPALSASARVPEPGTLLLVTLATMGTYRLGGRVRHGLTTV